jgi:hypothetical protein
MRGFDAIEKLADDYRWAVDLQICIFPQDGLTNVPGTQELLVEGLRRGARVIGAAPRYDDPEAALSCVEVFALGGRVGSADVSESGYFAVRGMLAKTVTEAARFVAERGVLKEGAPILLKFVTQVAARFGLVVTQKVAAQALPLVGALGGAAVNYAFIEHFQDVARGHFTVRRLERLYGKERIRFEYDLIALSGSVLPRNSSPARAAASHPTVPSPFSSGHSRLALSSR